MERGKVVNENRRPIPAMRRRFDIYELVLIGLQTGNAHAVEGTVYEYQGDESEDYR
jgi:hypothetical protein